LIGFNFSLFSQEKVTFKEFKNTKNIDSKTRKALALWEYFLRNDLDSLPIVAKELASQKNQTTFSLAVAKRIFGCYQVRKGKIEVGIELLKESKNHFLSVGDLELVCEELNELGIAYFLQGDLETALYYFKSSLATGAQSPRETDAILSEVNIAKVLIVQKDFKQATAVLNNYIFSAKELKKWEAVANAYSVLADVNLNLENYEKAKLYCEKQLVFAKKGNSFQLKINAKNNQALIYFFEGELGKSLALFTEIVELRRKQNIPSKMYDAYYNMASFYIDSEPKLAEKYLDSCIEIATNNNLLQLKLEAFQFKQDELKKEGLSDEIKSIEKEIFALNQHNEKEREELSLLLKQELIPIKEDSVWNVFYLFITFVVIGVVIIKVLQRT